jgi:hypothetical protein
MSAPTAAELAMRIEEMRDEALNHPGSAADQAHAQRRIDVLTERMRRAVRGNPPIVLVGFAGNGTRSHYLLHGDRPVCGSGSTVLAAPTVRRVDDTGVAATCNRCRRFESEALR